MFLQHFPESYLMHTNGPTTTEMNVLTSCVLESGDHGGCKGHTAEEPSALFSVHLPVIPYAHSHRVRATQKPAVGQEMNNIYPDTRMKYDPLLMLQIKQN